MVNISTGLVEQADGPPNKYLSISRFRGLQLVVVQEINMIGVASVWRVSLTDNTERYPMTGTSRIEIYWHIINTIFVHYVIFAITELNIWTPTIFFNPQLCF